MPVTVLMSLVGVGSLLGNGLVLLVYVPRAAKPATQWLVVAMATCDLALTLKIPGKTALITGLRYFEIVS